MQTELKQASCCECEKRNERSRSFIRACSTVQAHSVNTSGNLSTSLNVEPVTVAQPYQLEAERKRAVGIEYSRRSIFR